MTKLSTEAMASLEAALKVAFQLVFQLEEDEVASEALPSDAERDQLLFYESVSQIASTERTGRL